MTLRYRFVGERPDEEFPFVMEIMEPMLDFNVTQIGSRMFNANWSKWASRQREKGLVVAWCQDNISCTEWFEKGGGSIIRFKNEEDCLAFKLRWG